MVWDGHGFDVHWGIWAYLLNSPFGGGQVGAFRPVGRRLALECFISLKDETRAS